MGCFFSIVYYTLDGPGGDRMAIGMIAVDENDPVASCVFVNDWTRARHFGGEGTRFLREFVREIEEVVGPRGSLLPTAMTTDLLDDLARSHRNAIQVTQPNYAALGAYDWVDRFGALYIRGALPKTDEAEDLDQTKAQIASRTKELLVDVLRRRVPTPEPDKLVRRLLVFGPYGDERYLDNAVMNAAPHFGMVAVTLDHEPAYTRRQLDSTFATLEEIHTVRATLPLLLVTDSEGATTTIKPERRVTLQDRMRQRCQDLGVVMTTVDDEARIQRALSESLDRPGVIAALESHAN